MLVLSIFCHFFSLLFSAARSLLYLCAYVSSGNADVVDLETQQVTCHLPIVVSVGLVASRVDGTMTLTKYETEGQGGGEEELEERKRKEDKVKKSTKYFLFSVTSADMIVCDHNEVLQSYDLRAQKPVHTLGRTEVKFAVYVCHYHLGWIVYLFICLIRHYVICVFGMPLLLCVFLPPLCSCLLVRATASLSCPIVCVFGWCAQ